MLSPVLTKYAYQWPLRDLRTLPGWREDANGLHLVREMPETLAELAADSRWPALFPSPICLVTSGDGTQTALERVVGASVVNRFPYVVALSFCRQPLSVRHYSRSLFCQMLETTGGAAVQFLPPGPQLESALGAVGEEPDAHACRRIQRCGLPTRPAKTNAAPVFTGAYMVYEGRLVRPSLDFDQQPIHAQPWLDVGSHRVYFLEIEALQLRSDIASGSSRIHWRSLPAWSPQLRLGGTPAEEAVSRINGYQKPYNPEYFFPSQATTAFEADEVAEGMAIKHLPPLATDQVEVNNDRARWPCFFPQSVGMITTWAAPGVPNLMPCGSTTVVSRHPLVIAPCVSYAAINVRYAPRATLKALRQTGRFSCGVPFIGDQIVAAIKYAGNVSVANDPAKVVHAGLEAEPADGAPRLPALPIHFDCEVVGERRLGTHAMVLGEVRQIRVRKDVTLDRPLEWCPWAEIVGPDA